LVLHARVCFRSPHGRPLCFGAMLTDLVRLCDPPPHFAEHLDHGNHAEVLQLIGHGSRLHAELFFSLGHFWPLCCGFTVTDRLLTAVPPPHFLEQSPGLLHFETAQSIGQGCVLHCFCFLVMGHAFPPCLGWTLIGRSCT
jgi:hypothetical protein